MANKSYTKRIRVSAKGKLLARKPGGNHFNAKESRSKQLKRKQGQAVTMKPKAVGRYLKG